MPPQILAEINSKTVQLNVLLLLLLVPYLLDFQTVLRPCPQLLDQPGIDGDLFRKIRQDDISQVSDPKLATKGPVNPKGCGGGQNDPLVTDKACMPSIFIKTPQIFF